MSYDIPNHIEVLMFYVYLCYVVTINVIIFKNVKNTFIFKTKTKSTHFMHTMTRSTQTHGVHAALHHGGLRVQAREASGQVPLQDVDVRPVRLSVPLTIPNPGPSAPRVG